LRTDSDRTRLPGPRRTWLTAIAIALVALVACGSSVAAAKRSGRRGYARIHQACSLPTLHHASCLALVRTEVPATQANEPGVTPFTLHAGAASAGPAGGLTPAELGSAYGYDPRAGGSGQTVAIVDAFDDPSIASDLETFDTQYGLPACNEADGCFRKVGQTGSTFSLPTTDTTGWSVEEALDVETVHAVCTSCKVLLVEAEDTRFVSLAAAENEAVALGATEITNSYAGAEGISAEVQNAYNHPGVVITASTGDEGFDSRLASIPPGRPNVPASLPTVVAVGGTTLHLDESGNRESETVWDDSGGGCSIFFTAEPWQLDAPGYPASGCGGMRLDADVAAVGDPASGFSVYDSYDCGARCEQEIGKEGWAVIGGTSLSSPLIATLYALAGGSGGVRYPALTLYGHLGSAGLFDVTKGGNGFCDFTEGKACGIDEETGELLDCEGTTACNGAPGFDGPSGVGAPSSLALFEPLLPSAAISGPSTGTAGLPGTFSAVGASDPYPGGTVADYTWSWGDGTPASIGPVASHTYVDGGNYTVTLTITDLYGVSASFSAPIAVAAPVVASGVSAFHTAGKQAIPDAVLAAGALKAGPGGNVTVKISCPAGEASCSGIVTLQSTGAAGTRRRVRALTLATGSFEVSGGHTVAVKLHLSARARALLARKHRLRVTVTIAAHDPAGASHSSVSMATLRRRG
jgi:hypothetical protein